MPDTLTPAEPSRLTQPASAPPGDWPEITLFHKGTGGQAERPEARLLGKIISVDPATGAVVKDASPCRMAFGRAKRLPIHPDSATRVLPERHTDATACCVTLHNALVSVRPYQAIALGRLAAELPDEARAVLKGQEEPSAAIIARTGRYLTYVPGQPGFMLLDIDDAGMPPVIRQRVEAAGGTWAAIAKAETAIAGAACVERPSSSAGITDTRTGKLVPGGGLHIYLPVRDGSDIPRALGVLVARLTLAGLGWVLVGGAGTALHRTLVDGAVAGPERLVFEGAPTVRAPLTQDAAAREPKVYPGDWIDTRAALPDLTPQERGELSRIKAEAEREVAPALATARAAYVARERVALIANGASPAEADRRIRRRLDGGVLSGDDTLHFDDFGTRIVADVLADPSAFDGATLADPLEPGRGRNKAVFYAKGHRDGLPCIVSLIRGGTIFKLRYDATSLTAAASAASAGGDDPCAFVVEAIASGLAELTALERPRVLEDVAGIALPGGTKRSLDRQVAAMRQAIKEAEAAPARAAFAEPADTQAIGSDGIPTDFTQSAAGWHYRAEDDGAGLFIAGPFEIVGRAADGEGAGHSLVLRWTDADGRTHSHLVLRSALAGDPAGMFGELADKGLLIHPGQKERAALVRLLALAKPPAAVRLARRTGIVEGMAAFALPDGAMLGPDAKGATLAPGVGGSPLARRGNLDGWREGIAARAEGNPRLAFGLSVAVASVVADLLGDGGAIFNLVGTSSTGKSTVARCAASVWGAPSGPGGIFGNWRATANGLEAKFAATSGIGLILDELGQADAEDVAAISYAHSGGTGKSRARRDGSARGAASWRLDVLSTGEIGLSAALVRRRIQADAGQQVRFLDVPIRAWDAAHGGFAELHGEADGAALSLSLDTAAKAHCGHAGPAFVEWLLAQPDPAGVVQNAMGVAKAMVTLRLPAGAGAQATRAALHFARVGAAGELAVMAGVFPWQPGMATDAAASALLDHIGGRLSGAADAEAAAAVARVRRAIELHGEGRFVPLGAAVEGGPFDPPAAAPTPPADDDNAPLTANRQRDHGISWGFKSTRRGVQVFWWTDAGWAEVHRGFDEIAAAKALKSAGHLVPADGGNLRAKLRILDGRRTRCYGVTASILNDD